MSRIQVPSYADFKALVQGLGVAGIQGATFYWVNPSPTFGVTWLSTGIEVTLPRLAEQPDTFAADFPQAVQLSAGILAS